MSTNPARPTDGLDTIVGAPASAVTPTTGEHDAATMVHGPAATIDDDLQWVAVSAEHPCPICGASDGCGVAPCPAPGAIAVDCRSIASDRPMAGGGWFHRVPLAAAAVEALAVERC